MDVHSRIRKLREQNNITREDFAKKIDVTYAALSKYETGKRQPDYETLQKIADFFEVSTDYLLGRSNEIGLNKGKLLVEDDEENFRKWAKDSSTGAFFSEILESEEAEIEELREIWEIVKKRRKSE